MKLHPLVGLGSCIVAVALTAGAVAHLQGGDGPFEATSREFSIQAGFDGSRTAVSREFTIRAGFDGSRTAVSREFSFSIKTPDLAIDPAGVALPSEGNADQQFEVRWRVENLAETPAQGPWTDEVRFSTSMRAVGGGSSTVFAVTSPGGLSQGESYDRVLSFLMPQTLPAPDGTFTITLLTDAGNVVLESFEANNLFGPSVVTVHDVPRPNLTVAVTAEPILNVTAGDFNALSFRVWNDGAAPTNVSQWTDRVYVVPDADGDGFPPADVSGAVANAPFVNIVPLQHDEDGDGTTEGTFYDRVGATIQVPAGVFGPHRLAVRCDSEDAQIELDETDNLAWSELFMVNEPLKPDLQVDAVGLQGAAPGTPIQSGTLQTVQWNVTNLGPANFPATSVVTQLWIAIDNDDASPGALDGAWLLESFSDSIGVLGPGAVSPRSRQIFVPVDLPIALPSGGAPYYFKVRLDPNDALPEEEMAGAPPFWNNLATGGDHPVSLSATPNLIANQVGLAPGQGTPQIAHPLLVEFEVINPETSTWNLPLTWRDRLWLSEGDDVLDPGPMGDTLLGSYFESTVQLGGIWVVPAAYSKTVTVAVPQDALEGVNYYLILETDVDDDVFEFSGGGEGDNEKVSVSFTIERNPADLSIAAADGGTSPPIDGAPGQTIQLPWTVTNVGSGSTSASAWTDVVLLSPSATDLIGASTLLSATHIGVRAPGESYAETRAAQLPFVDPAQDWWLHFVTDVSGVVFEDGATLNNSVVTPFDITAILADLVVDSVSAAQRMRPGETVSVGWTARNAGSAATGASSWIDTVVLSETPDPAQSGSVWTLGSVQRGNALGVGSSYNVSWPFTLPLGLPEGLWYVVVEVDAGGSVYESDETNNMRETRAVIDIEAPPPGPSGGPGWLPANLVARDVLLLVDPVTAGQSVQLSWEVANEGIGATNVSSWADGVYLSLDGVLDAGDALLGFHTHGGFLGAGESRPVTRSFVVPAWALGSWVVIVDTDVNDAVFQDGATADDLAASAELLDVLAPTLTNLAVSDVTLPVSALLGDTPLLQWTSTNDSSAAIPPGWTWRDQLWLVPAAENFPSSGSRLLGEVATDALGIPADGMRARMTSSLAIPGIQPGAYRLVVISDSAQQIAELDESDNVFPSAGTFDLETIPISAGGSAEADLANGASRWFELTTAEDLTIDLMLVHDDPQALCELYVREGSLLAGLGTWDWRSEGVTALDPSVQQARIPRTKAGVYSVLARTVGGAGMASNATLQAMQAPFEVADVSPPAVGDDVVTIVIEGAQLWRASQVELRDASPAAGVEVAMGANLELLEDGTLLARFDLSGAAHGPRQVVAVDTGGGGAEAAWSGLLTVEAADAPVLSVSLDAAPNVRRGERGMASLTLTNEGNVDLPYAMATLGHARPAGAVEPEERVVVAGIESDGARDSLAIVVEDLRPGGTHELALEFEVGADYEVVEEEAAFAVACLPATGADFFAGLLGELSEALRLALVADSATPASLLSVAQDPVMWNAVVLAGLAPGGSIPVDLTTIHTPDSVARTARELVQAIADGVVIELMLPPGSEVPSSAVDTVASSAGCSAFAGVPFDCDALYPVGCSGESANVSVMTQSGGNLPSGVVCVATPAPDDPNAKFKPNGTGPQAMVNGGKPLRYEVHFENQASASAWASRISIEDPLDAGFRASSVRFLELRVGRTTIEFPSDTPGFLGQVPLSIDDDTDMLVQISMGVDALSREAFIVLQALIPETGQPPTAGDEGLLPPNAEGLEELATGYVAFEVMPDPMAVPGAAAQTLSARRMKNSARIRFNAQIPLPTNETQNTLDGGPPVSTLNFDAIVGNEIHFSWTATDVELLPGGDFPGSGVDRYSLYEGPTNTGPWTAILTDTQATSHVELGVTNTARYFKVEATDAVGIVEQKLVADLAIADCNSNGVPDEVDIETGTSQDANGNQVPDECECSWMSYCVSTPNSTGQAATISGAGLPSLSVGNFTLTVANLPFPESAIFFYGEDPAQIPFAGGFRCVQTRVTRLVPVMITGASGVVDFDLDLQNFQVPLVAGDVGYFQLFYRDAASAGVSYNLSDGLSVTFCE